MRTESTAPPVESDIPVSSMPTEDATALASIGAPRRTTRGSSDAIDVHVGDHARRALHAIEAHFAAAGVELTGRALGELRATVRAVVRESFLAGLEERRG